MREVEVESRFGRLPATVTGALSRSLGPTERMKTAEFLAVECRLATLDPHMRSNDMLNIACRRSAANGDLVCAYTEYEDVVREGLAAEALLGASCSGTLLSRGVDLAEDGSVADHSAIDASTSGSTASRVTYDPEADPSSLTERELELRDYVERYNKGKHPRKQIVCSAEAEADPSEVVYVSVDDVLAHRQTRTRDAVERAGGERPGERIFHSVSHVEADDAVYVLEARKQSVCYALTLACLLENGLEGREVVLFTDGEESLKEIADDVLSSWPHNSYLDYFHVKENIASRFSRAFRPGKVIDDTVEPERFKNGKVKKSSIAKITRSKYHLREVISMIWAGNVDGAIAYLREVDDRELKPGGRAQLDGVIEYLERKRDRIPCYAIRAHLGLRNSSNAVERANNALVSRRQKKKGVSWCDDGSFALAAMTAVFENGCAQSFFERGSVSLSLRGKASERGRKTGLEWVPGDEVQLAVTSCTGWLEASA